MILVTGGSASGKSAYAESLLTETEEGKECSGVRYYIATMRVYDGEDKARVEKHRRLRAGKRFIVKEQPTDLIGVLKEIRTGDPAAALLECIPNLAANEMFKGDVSDTADAVAERIVSQVTALDDALELLVVVTGNVFEDGIEYEPSVTEYLRALGEINRRLAERAQRVVEVVAGIPLELKPS